MVIQQKNRTPFRNGTYMPVSKWCPNKFIKLRLDLSFKGRNYSFEGLR